LIKKLTFLVWLFTCCYTLAYAQKQTTENSRILIVPFSRFDFQTSYSLSEIVTINNWKASDEVFGRYRDTLVKRLSQNHQNLSAFPIPAYEYGLIKNQLPRVYKEKPSTHFGIDMSLLKQNDRLKTLLTNFSADYILFISRYEISSRLVATMSSHEGSKFLPWANHEITYELFDLEGNLVVMADQFKVPPRNPYAENMDSKGVLLDEVAPNYVMNLDDIYQKLRVYQNQKRKKPVYRLKKN
jgi:hypothetical protein